MKCLESFKSLTRQELAQLNGGTLPTPNSSDGECADYVTPEPGRYCKSGQ